MEDKSEVVITLEFGSDFQRECNARLINEFLFAMKYSMESRHKKNKFEIEYSPHFKKTLRELPY